MISTVIRTCFPVAAKVVADRAEEINKLNVFPVPDGDTGTNMSLTLNTVVKEVEALPASATIDDIAKAITHGSLMGARGNSGVITSQILRGIAEGLCDAKNQDHPTPGDIAHAWRRGVKVAFKAVRKPVEGTILTVLRDVSAKADQLEKRRDLTCHEMLDALVVEAYESVARTPELLPVLKENGVVDSGAFGFATFLEAFVNAATGKAGELTDFKTTVDAKADVSAKVQIELNDDWEGSATASSSWAPTPTSRCTCTPTSPTACLSTCSSSARSTRSSSTTWTWSPTTAPPRSPPTRPARPRRTGRARPSASWPWPPARARRRSCAPSASTWWSRADRP